MLGTPAVSLNFAARWMCTLNGVIIGTECVDLDAEGEGSGALLATFDTTHAAGLDAKPKAMPAVHHLRLRLRLGQCGGRAFLSLLWQ